MKNQNINDKSENIYYYILFNYLIYYLINKFNCMHTITFNYSYLTFTC